MGENITTYRTDLKIFRGTYAEVQKQPTVNMTFYLAWDTQQLFVGNKNGVKVPYTGRYEKDISDRLSLFKDEVRTSQNKLRNEIFEDNKAFKDEVIAELGEITKNINDKVTEAIDAQTKDLIETKIIPEVLDQLDTETLATKDDINTLQGFINQNSSAISANASNIEQNSTSINHIRTSLESTNANVTKNSEDIAKLTEKVNSLDNTVVADKVAELERNYNTLSSTVEDHTSEISTIKTNINNNTQKISELTAKAETYDSYDSRISANEAGIQTLNQNLTTAKNELSERIDNINPGDVLPEFTTADSGKVLGITKDGQLGWIKASTAPVVKENVDAGFTLSVNPTKSYLQKAPIQLTITANVSHKNAIKSATLEFNGTSETIFTDEATSYIKTISNLSVETPREIEFTLIGEVADETETQKFTATSKSVRFKTITQWYVGVEGNTLERIDPDTTTFRVNVAENNSTVVIYATKGSMTFSSGGFEFPYDEVLSGQSYTTDDGLEISGYYKYVFRNMDAGTVSFQAK